MRIRRVTAWEKRLPLAEPYRLSGGRLKFEALDSTVVAVDADDGARGWGESCPWGNTYLPASGAGARAALALLAPVLIGRDPRDIGKLNRLLDAALPGHPHAKSPLDIALWDILGRRAGMPLHQLLGGAHGDAVDLSSSIPTGSPEEMAEAIGRARGHGCRAHSAKVGGDDPGLDIARVRGIEDALLPGESVTYDANRAWTPSSAIAVMGAAPAQRWFEQPCETLDQCVHVRRNTRQPIALDECLHTFQDHLDAWRAGACEGAKVKPNRLGGLTKARQARDFGVAVGWCMHVEDVGGTVLADTAALHLALSTPAENRLPSWLCHLHLSDDCAGADQGARNRQGRITLGDAPGLGVEPDPGWLGRPAAVFE